MASASSPSLSELLLNKGEEQSQQTIQQQEQDAKEFMYKTKTIQFLGRTTPIILQNENGPCPLLAICNVLLLRNNLNLNPDNSEVSQERLLSLVAERLIDSNSNNNDAIYIENQQQNIADAIDRLPCLATGIDVNIKFRRIGDFEFTPECAIFDLLDIPLYHGWIVDPQDLETANAIGSKSYNALMGDLVGLETHNVEDQREQPSGEYSVDFAAATAAALGVPSPCLSKTRSFQNCPPAVAEHHELRKGDVEEEAELLRALKLSENEMPSTAEDFHVAAVNGVSAFPCSDDNDVLVDCQYKVKEVHDSSESKNLNQPENPIYDDHTAFMNDESEQMCTKISAGEEERSTCSTTKADGDIDHGQSSSKESGERIACNGGREKSSKEALVEEKNVSQSTPTVNVPETAEKMCGDDTVEVSGLTVLTTASDSGCRAQHDISDALTSGIDDDEPIYEGEECVNSGTVCEDKEPVYEGETVLAEESDKNPVDSSKARAIDGLTPEQGELIRNFLKNSASQLTFYGLFCLQSGLKERELCVFFRNNHFSTMFKYEDELYLLATDQGYLNQPDLVWEKLNEVNGDTLFMTGDFKEFKVDDNANGKWDERNAVTSTADYLANINSASEAGFDMNQDLQLAIALQQQEFEQQPERNNTQTPSTVGASRLVTGPQGPRSSTKPSAPSSSRAEGKPSKDRCTVM